MKALFFFLFTFIYSLVFCQSDKYFIKIIGDTAPYVENGFFVKQLINGGYITGSERLHSSTGESDSYLVKTDPFGNIALDTIYVDTNTVVVFRSALELNNKDLVIAGYQKHLASNRWDSYVVKLDSNGTKIWEKTLGDSVLDNGSYHIKPTFDGGYILAGYKIPPSLYWDGHVIKIDSLGNVEWEQTFGGGGNDVFEWVEQTPDSGFLFAGGYLFALGQGSYWLLKTDKNGNFISQNTFNLDTKNSGFNVQLTNDGGYIICGASGSAGADVRGKVIKLNASMGIVWQYTLWRDPQQSLLSSYCRSIRKTYDGGYIVAGALSQNGFNNLDAILLKLDSSGNELWRRIYAGYPGTYNDYFYDIEPTTDGGYVMSGRTQSAGNADIFLVKTNCLGFTAPPAAAFTDSINGLTLTLYNQTQNADSCTWDFGDGSPPLITIIDSSTPAPISHTYSQTGAYTVTLVVKACGESDTITQAYSPGVTVNEETPSAEKQASLQIIPNPVRNTAVVYCYLPEAVAGAQLVIRDISGRSISSYPLHKNNNEISIGSDNFNNGVYLCTIMLNGKPVSQAKMVIIK